MGPPCYVIGMQEQTSGAVPAAPPIEARRPAKPFLRGGEARPLAPSPRLLRSTRAVRRGVSVLLWTLPAAAVQTVCLVLPGRPKVVVARLYWAGVCRLLGMRVRVLGAPMPAGGARAVVFASNHSSWLDIPVLGGSVEACFISKSEIGRWPLISTVAWLGRTVFVSRRATNTGRERDAMRARLARGDNLLLFPEGTSSDGSRVMPFRSAFFSVVESSGVGSSGAGGERPPLIQPVSIVYDQLGWLPIGRAGRPLFAWYGDMDLASHFWRVAQWRGLRATVLVHAPIDPAAYPSRKALAQAVWQTVADGASTLRQNRPATPLPAPQPAAQPSAQPGDAPAFA